MIYVFVRLVHRGFAYQTSGFHNAINTMDIRFRQLPTVRVSGQPPAGGSACGHRMDAFPGEPPGCSPLQLVGKPGCTEAVPPDNQVCVLRKDRTGPDRGSRFGHVGCKSATDGAGLAAGETVAPTFRDALETQKVCDAVLASAKNRQWQDV